MTLVSDAGGANAVTDIQLAFDDCASAVPPTDAALGTGVYRPSNFGGLGTDFTVQLTRPATLLSLVGRSTTGLDALAWTLLVRHDTFSGGNITINGWAITVFYSATRPVAGACGPDFDLDGVPDLLVGAGAGGGPHVQVLSGATGAPLASFFAYAPGFGGGVRVAACQLGGQVHASGQLIPRGTPQIVTAPGPGGGPHIRGFDSAGNPLGLEFFAYAPSFTGGVQVACADMNADGVDDIIVGPGPGGGPHVRVFDGRTGLPLAGLLGPGIFAFPSAFTGGVFVGP